MYCLPALFAVWANLHAGFLAGLITLGACAAAEGVVWRLATESAARDAAWRRGVAFAGLLLASTAAACANPYGWGVYAWHLRLLGADFFMNLNGEWLSPNFHAPELRPFELTVLAAVGLSALSRRRMSAVELVLLLLWLHQALMGVRYVVLWVAVASPILARLGVDVLDQLLTPIKPKLSEDLRGMFAGPVVDDRPAPWRATLVFALALCLWARLTVGTVRHDPRNQPLAGARELLKRADGARVFHDYNWGGLLIWHGWPSFKVWIDDRNQLYGQDHTRTYLNLLHARPGWEKTFAEQDFRWALTHPDSPITWRLGESGAWEEVYRDPYAVIHRRRE